MLANSAQGGKVCTSFPKGRQNMAILFPTAAKKAVLQSNHHKPQGYFRKRAKAPYPPRDMGEQIQKHGGI